MFRLLHENGTFFSVFLFSLSASRGHLGLDLVLIPTVAAGKGRNCTASCVKLPKNWTFSYILEWEGVIESLYTNPLITVYVAILVTVMEQKNRVYNADVNTDM